MKQLVLKISFVITLLFSAYSFAQLENANWYFGENGAGLDFNNNTVTVFTDGETLVAENFTATVSDNNGDLLFYTDGVSVWNKDHNLMPSGDGTLNGGSRTVSIVPFPGNTSKYYIFTIGQDGSKYDYFYSVIDMNLDNNLGDVEVNNRNVNLNLLPYIEFNQDGSFDIRSEMQRLNNMTVAKHSDGESYWLILNPFDRFFALKINANETIDPPIISNSNGSYNLEYPLTSRSGMSISPNMDKIAYFTFELGFGLNVTHLNIFNFNNSTGILSELYTSTEFTGFATEFSENGDYLYLLIRNGDAEYWIYQLDLQNINNNALFLGSSLSGDAETDFPTLVRGIDGKIYIPYSNNLLGVINSPNMLGANSNYVNNQINLGTNVIAKKLPQQIQIHNSNNCPENLNISQIVTSGNTDIQEAENWIIASNIIEDGANAEYDANLFVKLDVGFHAEAGSYFRAYIDGCTPLRLARNHSPFSKNKKEETKDIMVFPNPTKGKLNISSNQHIKQWQLINKFGKTLKNNNLKKPSPDIELSLHDLPTDIYILKIIFKGGDVVTKKIIKH